MTATKRRCAACSKIITGPPNKLYCSSTCRERVKYARRRGPKYSFAVRWRRRYHEYRQVRFFERRGFAERYATRLLHTYSDSGPVVDLVVQRRRVGPWVGVEEDEAR